MGKLKRILNLLDDNPVDIRMMFELDHKFDSVHSLEHINHSLAYGTVYKYNHFYRH